MALTSGSDSQREMHPLVSARVRDAHVREPFYLDGALDLVSVCRELSKQGLTNALVRDSQDGVLRLGIFSTTDLRDALLRAEPPARLAIREVARFDVIEVDADADLSEALWLLVRHRVQLLLVRDGNDVLGLLGEHDLVGFVANHSHIVAPQIDAAGSVDELKAAAERIDAMVALLHDGGVKIERIARLVGDLNHRLFAQLWGLVAPPDLVANSCLLVMGSEGRGEQIVKTDQDNALLLRDGFEVHPELPAAAARFNAALAEFGYPPCPGEIMLSNPRWRLGEAQMREALREWVYGSDPLAPMHLAIFFDAVAVDGDARLLDAARAHFDTMLAGSDAFLARFAAAADQFDDAPGWWARLTARTDEQALDLKKLGSFPIVHGVRALCLKHGVRESGTAERLRRLVAGQQLDASLGRDLEEALQYLMGLKLRHQLRQRAVNEPASNLVRPADLSTMDADQLKDALAIVKRFRAMLRQTFHLDSL